MAYILLSIQLYPIINILAPATASKPLNCVLCSQRDAQGSWRLFVLGGCRPERARDIIAAGVIPQTSYNNTSPDDPNNNPKPSLLLHEMEELVRSHHF